MKLRLILFFVLCIGGLFAAWTEKLAYDAELRYHIEAQKPWTDEYGNHFITWDSGVASVGNTLILSEEFPPCTRQRLNQAYWNTKTRKLYICKQITECRWEASK